jgi:hypothetical protein
MEIKLLEIMFEDASDCYYKKLSTVLTHYFIFHLLILMLMNLFF